MHGRRFLELVVQARRRVLTPRIANVTPARGGRPTARRQLGGELTRFSFRLALVIDLAYVGIGALGGAAVGRASAAGAGDPKVSAAGCDTETSVPPIAAAPNDSQRRH